MLHNVHNDNLLLAYMRWKHWTDTRSIERISCDLKKYLHLLCFSFALAVLRQMLLFDVLLLLMLLIHFRIILLHRHHIQCYSVCGKLAVFIALTSEQIDFHCKCCLCSGLRTRWNWTLQRCATYKAYMLHCISSANLKWPIGYMQFN